MQDLLVIIFLCSIDDYMYGGQYVGNASDPNILLDQLTSPIDSLVGYINFYLKTEKFITFSSNEFDQLNWTRSVYILYGMCYSLHTSKETKEKGITGVTIYLNQNILVFVHSPGIWKQSAFTQAQLSGTFGKPKVAKLVYTVYHLLDYHGEPCEDSDSYSFDDCFFHHLDDKIL